MRNGANAGDRERIRPRNKTTARQQMSELIASTRLYALSNRTTRNEASTQKQKTVNFQDTYRLEYIDEESSHAGPRRTATNANAQHPQALNPTAQNFTPQRDDVNPRDPQEQPQPHARIRQESWGRGSLPSNSQSRYSGEGTTLHQFMNLDVGRTLRQWKLQFTGEIGSSIEEFIERINECRSLVRIAGEDLLNAISELTFGVARHWCRQARKNWRTWEDFCTAARRCYGVDKRFQQRLVGEAQAYTQGREEPVRDYIICLLTILRKFEELWDDERQLKHIYRIKEAERSYKHPPAPDDNLLPEVAYKGPKIAKTHIQRGKDSLAAMVACASSQDSEGTESTNEAKPDLAAIAAQSTQGLDQLISRILAEKLAKEDWSGPQRWPRAASTEGRERHARDERSDLYAINSSERQERKQPAWA